MPAAKKTGKLIPKKAPEVLANSKVDVLNEFDDFVAKCKEAVNAKIKSLTDTGRDPVGFKTAADRILIDQFRGSKWAP